MAAATVNLVDRVQVYSMASGTGPFSLGAAVPSYRGVEALLDGHTYRYVAAQGSNYEVGSGVYSAGSSQLTRSPMFSSNSGAPVSFGAGIPVSFTATAEDLVPPGSTNPVGAAIAGGTIALGAPVNIYDVAGVAYAQNADASAGLPAHGFAGSAATGGTSLPVIGSGLNPNVALATSGRVWLDDSAPGGFTTTQPTTSGHLDQIVGVNFPGLGILFTPSREVIIP